ncbi:MAG: hypothetical protein NZ927_05955 [Candidatus Calescibacterium sp.]|nr:hypothetical protein [Candidatus Calescibacterium sp.]MCX7734561.1 hypothetical protein [bacterium]
MVEGDSTSSVKYGFTVINLSEIPFERFLESENPSVNTLVILSNYYDGRRLLEKITEYGSKTALLIDKIYSSVSYQTEKG